MALPPFTLHRPREIEHAVDLLGTHGDAAAAYMGGTELLLLMKLGFAKPGHLVDLKHIPGLAELRVGDSAVHIGAGVTHRRLERHGDVARAIPTIAEMERQVANIRVRNAGTLGGNLCFAEPNSDPAALFTALRAHVVLTGRDGTRDLPIDQFLLGAFETALRPGELMVRIDVPVPAPGTRVGYARMAFRERPAAGVAVAQGPDGCAVVLGALGPRPLRVDAAERLLEAGEDEDAIARAVSEAAARHASGDDVDFRAHLAGVLYRRARAGARPVGPAAARHAAG